MTLTSQIYTVSSLNQEVNLLLNSQMGRVWLVGEVSNFSVPGSGHWYFSLKDHNAQVKCAMFKGRNNIVQWKPKVGDQVLVRAQLSLYEPRGDYQLIIETMQPEGSGVLQQQFEALKTKLASEGLFASALKKPLPEHPKAIGIISSATGAALQDILQILNRRAPTIPVVIYPAQVQGKIAPQTLINALNIANLRRECDVIILGRGGGSQEDLSCFNDEALARTIVASVLPVVSAVGHETDFTISDFVSDVRAPTPSAAAELVTEYLPDLSNMWQRQQDYIIQLMQLHLYQYRQKLQRYQLQLKVYDPQHKLKQQMQKMDDLSMRLQKLMPQLVTKRQQRFQSAVQRLQLLSPLATLSRGYSITRISGGDLLKSNDQVHSGLLIETQLAEGLIRSIVV